MNWDEMTAEERYEQRPDLAECIVCGGLGGDHDEDCGPGSDIAAEWEEGSR
jgi:hypothetical protein